MGDGVRGKPLIRIGAKHLGPAAARDMQRAGQRRRNGAGKFFLGGRRVVADGPNRAGFVFHLHHDHGALRGIRFANVAHECGEGVFIGFEIIGGTGGKNRQHLPVGTQGPRITLCVVLHPLRNVMRLAILPGTEPEQHQSQMVLPRPG